MISATIAQTRAPGVRAVEAVAFSFLIGLCAQIEVRLPWTVVPVTGQSLAVLFAGAALGSRWGSFSTALYLLEGASGLPFFAGGAFGLWHLLGPTGGYLIGFVPAAWLVGRLAESGWDRSPGKTVAMLALGSAVIFTCGLAWLSRFLLPGTNLLSAGLLPFIPGDCVKIAIASAALPLWRKAADN